MGGLSSPLELCQRARDLGQKALALTDTNGFYGLVHFVQTARELGLKPIIGVEVVWEKERFLLWCRDRKGYEACCLLLSQVHMGSPSYEWVIKHLISFKDHLVIASDRKGFLLDLKNHIEHLYFECSKGFYNFTDIKWLKKEKIKPLATCRIHYIKRDNQFYYRLIRAIDENTTLERVQFDDYHNKYCFYATNETCKAWFELLPEAMENTYTVARLCRHGWFDGALVFPRFKGLDLDGASTLLRQKCLDNISWRYPSAGTQLLEKVQARLNYELEIIQKKHFSNYFLVVDEFVSQSAINCGRGSGAASLVCFLLGITHVDPIAHNLFFERFLNEKRVDPPDIDIDFPWDERDDVLDYVFEKYQGRAAMVANHNFLRDRSAIREVAKVFGINEDEISYITNRLPRVELDETWKQILHHASRIEGVLRHLSVHCGGVVITPERIDKYVPIEMATKGVPVIQWEKDQAEEGGLVKIDLLGNRSLAVVRDALESVNHNYDKTYDYRTFNPLEDKKTKEMMIKGETMGVFYVESPGTRLYLQKQKSGEFEHNVVAGSVIRPAARRWANTIAARINGEPYEHFHPLLADILEETFGVMIYQEQVTQTAMILADFDVVEGNDLRKVLGKKHKQKKLSHYKEKFYVKALAKGIPEKTLDEIWDMIMSFAGYSFCKPHSASYCLVSYKAAYLKAHYPAEFMAAVISNQGGFYSTNAYLEEARRMGARVLPPDINHSEIHLSAEDFKIRTGLMLVKGLRNKTMIALISERNTHGPFISIEDFLFRVTPAFDEAKALVKARSFNSIREEKNLVAQMWEVYLFYAQKQGVIEHKPTDVQNLPVQREYEKLQMVRWEQEYLGGCVTFPSWMLYRNIIQNEGIARGIDFPTLVGQHIVLFGEFVTCKAVRTKKGDSMMFVSFSDDTAIYEAILFPESYLAFRDLIFLRGAFLIEGIVQNDMDSYVLQVTNLRRIEGQERLGVPLR